MYAKPNLCDVEYISRYLGHPVIATSHIDSFDGDNVTFHYNRHEDNAYVEYTVTAMDFIKLLIQHIPEKYFKMTRYYGLYARHREIDQSLHKAISKSKQRILMDFNTWRKLIILSFGYDLLQCPKRNHMMEFWELYNTNVFLWQNYTKEQWLNIKPDADPAANVFDFISHLRHTGIIKRAAFDILLP